MFAALACVTLMAASASATLEAAAIEEVTIIGSTEAAREIAGSGALIDEVQIRDELATDINQLLKTIPGTYIREEDGYGLRPNIGIRGATSERSAKITLMEDGVLIAPAPYAAPEAYYFPTLARMQAVEVLKGASQLRYGPQTTGGVINLVSTREPEEASGRVQLVYGQDNQTDFLAHYGLQWGAFGISLETAQRRNDGFKHIDRSGADTGYQIADYVAKISWRGGDHALRVKAQYSDETSDETYLGLTDRDFQRDPDRRYGMSAPDRMSNDHKAVTASWDWNASARSRVTTTVYRNEFHRDWFKLSGAGSWIAAANAGDTEAQAILDGERDVEGLQFKHNNRRYVSQGVQTNWEWEGLQHSISLGARYHEDDVDRFQPVELYDQLDGDLYFRGQKAPGASDNRLQMAEAVSLWATDAWQVSDALRLDLALRFEQVDSSERRFANQDRSQAVSSRANRSTEWLPGLAAHYQLNDGWSLLAGVHRGFSPLGASALESENPETSINYEAGVRYDGVWFAELIGFYSDFSDKGESCSNASPCSNGATIGSFVTGEAVIAGMELQLGHIWQVAGISWPMSMSYTYSRAEASRDDEVSGVRDGDTLASIPEHTLSFRLGAQIGERWDSYVVLKYADKMCVKIGCNRDDSPFAETDDFWIVDLGTRYQIASDVTAFVKLENAFNERAIVSRQPDGARPNKPMTALVGVEWLF